jgi:hypothetical protein
LKITDPELIRKELQMLIMNFEAELKNKELRPKVLSLVLILGRFRALGISLSLPGDESSGSARQRILSYFQKYPLTFIKGDELFIISGIQEYARRVRELRVQFGWSIISGLTAKEMSQEGEFSIENFKAEDIKPNKYILISQTQDTDAAYRWNVANDIRKSKDSVRNKILFYLKHHVSKPVTGEELRYVAGDKTEWARRVRELKTEFGWPIITKNTGNPDLPVGTYLLESLRQSPKHDRKITDYVRGRVLRRDGYKCVHCNWDKPLWDKSDPRHLELHHVKEHAKGGENTEDNLITLCTVCHDQVHRKK